MPAAKRKPKTIAAKASDALDTSKKALAVAVDVVSDVVTAVQHADSAFKKARSARTGTASKKSSVKKSGAKKSAAKKTAAKKAKKKK